MKKLSKPVRATTWKPEDQVQMSQCDEIMKTMEALK